MPQENTRQNPGGVLSKILTDVHFWVPTAVLLAGLVVLHWIR